MDAHAGPAHVKLGIGFQSDIGFKDWTLNGHLAGCGISIGKKMGVELFGNELSLDLGTLFTGW